MKTPSIIRLYFDQIRLTWRLLKDRRVAWWMKSVALLPILYLIFPIDILPDFIALLGQLDDFAIFYAGMRLFESIVPAYIVKEHRAAIAYGAIAPKTTVSSGQTQQKD